MPRIADFCSCIYVLGCKLSLVRFCDSDFGITPVDDIAIRITCAALFSEHPARVICCIPEAVPEAQFTSFFIIMGVSILYLLPS